MSAEYTFLVEKAKLELKSIEDSKAEIARLAVEACTIKHGRSANGTYTLKMFADDVGVKYSTISKWVLIYRQGCLSVGIERPTKEQWNNAGKTLSKFKTTLDGMTPNERIKVEGHRPGMDLPDKGKELLKTIHQNVVSGNYNSGSDTFNEILKDLKRMHGRIEKLDLNTQDATALLSSMILCDEISDMINLFLTNKKKKRAS